MQKTFITLFKKDSDIYTLITTSLSLGEVLITVILFLFFYQQLPSHLPLLYSLPWGEGQLINKLQFFAVPTLMVAVTLGNLSLTFQLHPQQLFLKRVLNCTSLAATTVLFISALKIITIFV